MKCSDCGSYRDSTCKVDAAKALPPAMTASPKR
jgi:hypothetical protein